VSRRRVLGILVGLAMVAAAVMLLVRQPSQDRAWAIDQSRLPETIVTADTVTIRDVRNFAWTGVAAFTPAWEDRTYRLDQVATVWYVLVPFAKRWRGPAHSFVSFGFDDGRYLAISVEARRERTEEYGVLAGMLRKFELIYVIGDERDLIGRRALYDGGEVFLYPIRASREKVREVFVSMLERANALRRRPEFYNTVTNNCTSNLVRHVNLAAPGLIPYSWKMVAPGYSDEVAYRLSLIDSTGSLTAMRDRFRINQRAAAAYNAPDFSARIRATGP
jgi:uncharacterized protein DUF4105